MRPLAVAEHWICVLYARMYINSHSKHPLYLDPMQSSYRICGYKCMCSTLRPVPHAVILFLPLYIEVRNYLLHSDVLNDGQGTADPCKFSHNDSTLTAIIIMHEIEG